MLKPGFDVLNNLFELQQLLLDLFDHQSNLRMVSRTRSGPIQAASSAITPFSVPGTISPSSQISRAWNSTSATARHTAFYAPY